MIKITLQDARERNGMTKDETADHFGMTTDHYSEIEDNPGQAPLSIVSKIASLFNTPLSMIYSGVEVDCITYNRSRIIRVASTTS